MRDRCLKSLLVLAFLACSAASGLATQSSKNELAGTWTGTWDGAGSGEFELTFDTKDGALVGRVAVTTDGGNYTADLKGVALEGKKLAATYDFPLDPSAEVVIGATFDDRTATGTWTLRPKGQTAEIAAGTWKVTKK